jgi:hypothetical protein
MTGAARSDPALRRGFAVALVVVLVVVAALGLLIRVVDRGHHRPEGIAEHWLAAVSDTTRKGVRGDAQRRAEKIGPLTLAVPLLPAGSTHGKAAFDDLEVGKARVQAGLARVPFRLHQHAGGGSGPVKQGAVILARAASSWRVTTLDMATRLASDRVPSQGGAPPSRAPLRLWVGTVLLGLVLTAVGFVLMERISRSTEASLRRAAP